MEVVWLRRWAPLTNRQLDVLRRVGDVDDQVTAGDSRLAVTVYALRDRRLVTTPRFDGVWKAEITEAGRFYLEHGYHPDRPSRGEEPGAKPVRACPPAPTRKPAQRKSYPVEISVEELMARLEKASGRLQISDRDLETRAAWRRAIHAAKQSDLVPAGMHLRHHGRDSGDLIIELAEGEHPDSKHWKNRQRIDVAASLDQPHHVVAQLRCQPGRLGVSKESLDRALRVIQSLVAEWTKRGHKAELGDGDHGFVMLIRESSFTITMEEEYKPAEYLPSPEEVERKKIYSWQRVQPETRRIPTGRLTLELPPNWGYSGQRRRWADRERWSLEDKLGDILSELEARAQLDDERRIARADEKVRRQQQWESAMTRARFRYTEEIRIRAITEQANSWDQAARIRAYCAELEATLSQAGEITEELAEWITWARSYADGMDPLRAHGGPPEIPEPRPQDLKPYLGRWSPYGPDSQW